MIPIIDHASSQRTQQDAQLHRHSLQPERLRDRAFGTEGFRLSFSDVFDNIVRFDQKRYICHVEAAAHEGKQGS